MSEPTTRWAVLGASDIAATRIIPAIRAHGGVVTVVQSSTADRAESYAAEHDIGAWTTSVADAVGHPDIDAVYVGSHNRRHRDQVVAAAEAGRHVLAEKPLALTLDDARAMVEACDRARVVMATNHHLPASPVHRAMKDLVAADRIGAVRAVHVNHAVGLPDRLAGWRVDDPEGGGVVLDVFIHDMAAVAAIAGGQAAEVSALARRADDVPAAPNSVMTVVRWIGGRADGAIVQTHDAYDNYHLPTSLEILGDRGAIRSSNSMTGDPVGTVTVHDDDGETEIDVPERDDLYLTIVRAFDRAVHHGERPLVTGPDGLRSLAAALAAQESLRTGRTVSVEAID